MQGRTLITAGTVAASMALAGGAFADKQFIEDATGDSKGNNIDVVAAKAGHAPGEVIKIRATFAKKVNPNDTAPNIHVSVPGGGPGAEYFIGPAGNGSVTFFEDGSTTGKASITPVGENGFKYKFREKAIGDPKRYAWAVVVEDADDQELFDRAPDSGFMRHGL